MKETSEKWVKNVISDICSCCEIALKNDSSRFASEGDLHAFLYSVLANRPDLKEGFEDKGGIHFRIHSEYPRLFFNRTKRTLVDLECRYDLAILRPCENDEEEMKFGPNCTRRKAVSVAIEVKNKEDWTVAKVAQALDDELPAFNNGCSTRKGKKYPQILPDYGIAVFHNLMPSKENRILGDEKHSVKLDVLKNKIEEKLKNDDDKNMRTNKTVRRCDLFYCYMESHCDTSNKGVLRSKVWFVPASTCTLTDV